MRPAPDRSQPPQASASTNSAIRAELSETDEECPNFRAESSTAEAVEKFPGELVAEGFRSDGPGNNIQTGPSVYFIANHDRSMIKIGKSRCVTTRLADLSRMNGSPITLLAHARGYTEVEKFLHRRFSKDRRHGEWFAPSPALDDLIGRAANDPGVTLSLCPRAVKSDEAPPTMYNEELDLDRDPVGDEKDIRARWQKAGGHILAGPVDVEWASIGEWSRRHLDGAGAWRDRAGHIYVCQYVGIMRVASQLVDIEDHAERQLAFIHAAYLDRDSSQLYGKHWHSLDRNLKRRIQLGQARHALPSDPHHCGTCRRWYDMSASSSGEWLARLAHVTKMPDGLHLIRVRNAPDYR